MSREGHASAVSSFTGLAGAVLGLLLTACGETEPQEVPSRVAAEAPALVDSGLTLGRYPIEEFLIDHDRFLPATDPAIVPAAEATWLGADAEVFGVFRGEHARAYPVTMISYHHVVNDMLDGVPLLVTY